MDKATSTSLTRERERARERVRMALCPCGYRYLANMLAHFARTERLFEATEDGLIRQPLATLYARALAAPNPAYRHRALQHLGDVALLIAGLFADSLRRRVVDVDYYVAMGSTAYGCLSDASRLARNVQALRTTFSELAAKFPLFVDVLGEVGEHCGLGSQNDLVRLYEIWARTGSPRAAKKLRGLGIEPVKGSIGQRPN